MTENSEGLQHISKSLPKLQSQTKQVGEVEPEIVCKICGDYGWIHPLREDGHIDYSDIARCECKVESDKQHKRKALLKKCGLPYATKDRTFDNFIIDKRFPILAEAKEAAMSLAEGTAGFNWLILKGKVDIGKSHLAIAICRRWLERGVPAIYTLVPATMDNLRSGFDLEGEESYRRQLQFLKDVELLVLDDLGAGKVTEWAVEKLMIIIDHRSNEGLPLVVTTNKDLNKLPFDDEHRIASRLLRYPKAKHVIMDNVSEYRLRRDL